MPMPSLVNDPFLWHLLLQHFPKGAIIAGGAVRDYFLGVEPKDIDVFMPAHPWPDLHVLGFERVTPDEASEYLGLPLVSDVWRGTMYGRQIDCVAVNARYGQPFDGPSLVPSFDFGVTRSWYDGEVHETPAALMDRNTRTVTLLLHDRPRRALDRFKRFNARTGGDWRPVGFPSDPG